MKRLLLIPLAFILAATLDGLWFAEDHPSTPNQEYVIETSYP